MKWQQWLENWDMTTLKIKAPFLDMEWKPKDADKAAAWELYVELLTRVTTQDLPPSDGDEERALSSIFNLFELTRGVLKHHGRDCIEFTKIAVILLNQVVRPFTAKWHPRMLAGDLQTDVDCLEFRTDLRHLQGMLRVYTRMLADMAGVEDLTEFEESS